MRPGLISDIWNRLRQSAMFYGALGTLVRVSSQVLLLPLVLRLPPAELAIWIVFLSLGALANLADFGFGPAVMRVYSIFWAGAEDYETVGIRARTESGEPNLAGIRRLHATVAFLYHRVAAAATAVLALGGTLYLLPDLRAASPPWHLWSIWIGYLLVIGYSLATSYWSLSCQGINQVRQFQISNVCGGLAYLLVGATLLLIGWGLLALVIATAVRSILSRWICRVSYHHAVPGSEGVPVPMDRSLLKRLWPNAREFGIMSLGAYLVSNSSILLSKKYLPDEITASLGVTQQIGVFAVNLAALWLTIKWPQITILRAQGKSADASRLFARRFALTMVTLVALAAVVILVGNPILAWKGTRTQLLPTLMLAFYMGYLVFQTFYVMFGLFTFTENTNPFFRYAIGTGVATMGLSFWWVPVWGLWGLLWAPLLAEATINAGFTVWRGFKGQPLSLPQFIQAALRGRLG
jgi:O-antigen/teichoic acid export membrane protein